MRICDAACAEITEFLNVMNFHELWKQSANKDTGCLKIWFCWTDLPFSFEMSALVCWYKTLSNSGIGPSAFQIMRKYDQHTRSFINTFFRTTIKSCFPLFNGQILCLKAKKRPLRISLLVGKKKVKETKTKHCSNNIMVDKLIKFNDKYYAWRKSSMSSWKSLYQRILLDVI